MYTMKSYVIDRFNTEFGPPTRETVKVKSWNASDQIGVVINSINQIAKMQLMFGYLTPAKVNQYPKKPWNIPAKPVVTVALTRPQA
jgi:hypothetical protein